MKLLQIMKNTMKKITKLLYLNLLLTLCLLQSASLFAQQNLPLFQIGDLEYQGAFAIPSTGPSDQLSANYSTGTIAYNSANGSLFLSGFQNDGVIAEFSIPQLNSTKTDATALTKATFLQDFRPILNAAPTGNPQNIDRINGMALINGKLIVNALEYYDNDFDTHTTLVVENPSNIANSAVNGYYSLGGAAHAAGWISAIPSEWQSSLGGSYISGNSSRYSINGRLPMGITAFAFNPSNISGASGAVATTTLLDFSLANPLYAQYEDDGYVEANYNLIQGNPNLPSGHTANDANIIAGSNDLWTEESQANYGFIVPGTRTYLTIGSSAGHNSGIGYKPSQDNDPTRQECPGPCSYDSNDYYNYYWLWDVNDLVDVRNGVKAPHDVRPYDYGVFEELFRTNVNPLPADLQVISGGTFDAGNGILYLSISDGASTGAYDKVPAIVAYKVNGGGGNNCTIGATCNDGNSCTTGSTYDANCNCTGGTFQDADGDGVCAANDPNDNDPCVPNACNGGECELLTNTNFDNNTDSWIDWGANVASVNGTVAITNIISSTQPWEVGFIQSNIPMEQGENYTIKFRARADANRPLDVRVEQSGGQYTEYYQTNVNLTTTMQDYTLNFTMNESTDNNANFIFYMGGNTTSTYIDNASLKKANCSPSCPEQGQNCNDNNSCTTGETYDANCNCNGGTFQDADNDVVCDADDACPGTDDALIGTTCNDFDSCTTGETYDANCNCTGGTFQDADGDGVCAANDPNDNDPCVPNACNGGECELLTNTNFDSNINNWVHWGCDAASVNGIASLTNIDPGVNPWDVALSQSQQNITLEQGETYTITFRARADGNRPLYLYVGMNQDPYTAYLYETFNLTTNMQVFSRTFTMTNATDYNINFDFNMGGNGTSTYIDYASLKKVNCGTCPPAGTICNDDNPNTENDVQDGFCNCSGTPITPPPSGQCDCPDLSTNGPIISVSNITQLQNAINNSNGNETIMVQPGNYVLNYGLIISADKPNLTIMGATGNRDDVTLRGLGWNNSAVTHIFDVSADGFTVANMTVRDVYYHLIQIHSENDADDFTAQNVRFIDAKEQLLKVSAGASTFSDRGRILCCEFEFTAGIAYQNYTGGIDAHKSKDWLVQNNVFKGIRSPDGVVAEHAIHFWRDCEGTNVIGNQIERCDRGIGFGLGDAYENGHRGGLIMNNFVHTNRDVGIGLEYAPNIKVYNNTVITDNYPRSIEYRFSGTTNVQILNNLVSGQISDRGEGANGYVDYNYTASNLNIFTDAANHDYHLVGTPSGIVNAGTALSEVTTDIDCDNRTSGIDIGADEVSNGGNGCQQQGQICNDGDNCTIGETYDANCNCIGGTYTDNDNDGLCIGNDPNDNDPCNPNACNDCGVFDEENFESGWGIWNDGGSDARRNVNDAPYANSGSRCIRLRDNSGSVSSMYTDALDMSAITSVDVSFSYIANSMENNEDFFLEFSTDNGTSYAVVGRWIRGRDFDNGTRYNETVTIDGPLSSNTRVRFRCDASGNGDLVYIDDVTIEACGGTISPAKIEVLPSSISVNLYPNPTNHSVQLDCEIFENTQAQIQVYDNVGQLVKNISNIELHEGTQTLNVDVSDLPAGMYFCALQSNEWQTVKKFVIAR